VRPIVSANCHPTETISEFIDFHLWPFVENLPSYIKDTTDYMKKMENLTIPENTTASALNILSEVLELFVVPIFFCMRQFRHHGECSCKGKLHPCKMTYLQKAERQLSDCLFYEKFDSDSTLDFTQKITRALEAMHGGMIFLPVLSCRSWRHVRQHCV
jgi:hypothetical protein